MSKTLDPAIRKFITDKFYQPGFMSNFDTRIVTLEYGLCVIEMPASPLIVQDQGFFHGGAIGALGDTAGGTVARTVLSYPGDVLALEYKVNFLRPGVGDKLVARASVLRKGRSAIITRVDIDCVTGGETKLCAAMQQTVVPVGAG